MCTDCQRRKKNERNDDVKKPNLFAVFVHAAIKKDQIEDHDEFHSSIIFPSIKLTTKWRRTFSRQISDNHFCLFRNFFAHCCLLFPILSLSSISIEVNPICSN